MDKQEFFSKLAAATNQSVAKEIQRLTETVREYVDADLAPDREQIRILQGRCDHLEARLYELENAKQPAGKLASIR